MIIVYLISGTRGAGKSTYCKKITEKNPKICLISRDQILIDLFGQNQPNRHRKSVFLSTLLLILSIPSVVFLFFGRGIWRCFRGEGF